MWKNVLFLACFFICSSYSLASMAHREGHSPEIHTTIVPQTTNTTKTTNTETLITLLFLSGLYVAITRFKISKLTRTALAAITLPITYIACTPTDTSIVSKISEKIIPSDINILEKTFGAFNNVKTRSDDTYFYVESQGLPEHNMMVGITSWQQQVALAQNYTGDNAWSIPLQPVLSESPVSTKNNFFRGGVGIAANGIPIFNALNNRGDDAFLVGELDQWGGHAGRADDYHYHTAPLHLEEKVGNNPIAYALDGFAVYGSKEPDGSTMRTLDENNGHFDTQGAYHYHGTTTYPYMIGKMRGKVTKSQDDEITPQPRTIAIRDFLQPLNGAKITDFKSTGTQAYSLEYSINDQKHYVDYSWDNTGKYTFTFISADGTRKTETYQRRDNP